MKLEKLWKESRKKIKIVCIFLWSMPSLFCGCSVIFYDRTEIPEESFSSTSVSYSKPNPRKSTQAIPLREKVLGVTIGSDIETKLISTTASSGNSSHGRLFSVLALFSPAPNWTKTTAVVVPEVNQVLRKN